MSNYIEENLGKDEKVIMEAKLNKLCFVPKIIAIALGIITFIIALVLNSELGSLFTAFTIFLIALSVSIIVRNVFSILSLWKMQLVITDKRVLGKVGFLSISALDYPIEKVDNVSLKAGIFGNIFKYYTLSVQSAGSSGVMNTANGRRSGGISFDGIENAVEFKNLIVSAIEQHAEDSRKLQAEEIAKAMSGK